MSNTKPGPFEFQPEDVELQPSPPMKTIDNGGPAFPVPTLVTPTGEVMPSTVYHGLGGMTLRDWFAGQALNGMDISQVMEDAMNRGTPPEHFARALAIAAYKLADGMIATRSQKP